MEKAKFLENLINKAKQINVVITEEKANRFYEYNNLLLEWNEKINLTAITDEREIILKHFIDSLTINRYIGNAETVMDIGTGAGFPGIPLKIVNENKSFILVDALNKRINFLEEVKNNLKLNDLDLIHSRSEDLAINVCKEKHLTNTRASGSDEALRLVPPIQMSLEKAIEFIQDDELVEVTPKNIRLRKKILDNKERERAARNAAK